MVDAYLEELLAPLAPEPPAPLNHHAEKRAIADSAAKAAALMEAIAGADPTVTLVPGTAPELPDDARPDPQRSAQHTLPLPNVRQLPEPALPLTDNGHRGTSSRVSQGTSGNRWLRAALGKDRYAFELLRVQEVVRMSPIIGLRGTPPALLGVMNLRGQVVPVFDLAQWLGTGRVDSDEQARIIVVERADELIGVLVSAVDDVVTLSREHIEPPLPGTDPGGMVGIARVGPLPTVLLDANALFN